MSANNWTVCPICHNLPEEWRNGIDYLYGKIPRKKFQEIEKEYEALQIETVREDWNIGLDDDGAVSIHYSAECHNCGAKWHYKKTGIHKD